MTEPSIQPNDKSSEGATRSRLLPNLGAPLGKAVNLAGHSLNVLGGRLGLPKFRRSRPGTAPGLRSHDLAQMPKGPGRVEISCLDYAQGFANFFDVLDLDQFIAARRPEGTKVRWINVNGLSDPGVINLLATKYNLHPLAVEDMVHVPQRPKVDSYLDDGQHQARLFIVSRMIQLKDGHVHSEQVSIFLGHGTVLTFQESPGDPWDPIRHRIRQAGSHLRNNDASYLVYALLDALIDHCFPILESYSTRLESLEERVVAGAEYQIVHDIYQIRRELLLLGRQIWPMREVIHIMQHEKHECLSENTRVYLRDVYDHAVQILEILETYRELAGGLADTQLTVQSNRMNEVMKVLTTVATIFIPITFLAGVYGTNFQHLPEYEWKYGYYAFWAVCATIATGMLLWFRKRKWI